VVESIPTHGTGRIEIGHEEWIAESDGAQSFKENDRVTVQGVSGTHLIVTTN